MKMKTMTMPKISLPSCCGREMNAKLDLGRFWEAHCDICDDVVYIKKSETSKPHMIDD